MSERLPDDERVGSQIAERYRLDSVIGKGGMGVVYRGLHLWTERPVAVKLLATEGGDNAAKRFLREARTAASVRHPNLVEVLDVGQAEDGLMYQVLELLEGESLLRHLERKRDAMRSEDVLDVLVPILDALAALHAANVVHRDLKPGNIFLSTDGRGRIVPKLLDLGISKRLDADEALTVTGALMGTPSYMSPEQARGETVGFAADIWAMGIVLFQCLSGERPFRSDSIPGLLHLIATERPAPILTVSPNLPGELAQAVDRALAYEADARHPSATAFADALVNAAMSAGWPITCRIPSGPRIDLSHAPEEPNDTLDPDATPISADSKPVRAPDPDATPASDEPVPLRTPNSNPPAMHRPLKTPPPHVDGEPASGALPGPAPMRKARPKQESPPRADPTPGPVSTRTGWMNPSEEELLAKARGIVASKEPPSESVRLPMRRPWAGSIGALLVLVIAGGIGWAVAAQQMDAGNEQSAAAPVADSAPAAEVPTVAPPVLPSVGAAMIDVDVAPPPTETATPDAGPPRQAIRRPGTRESTRRPSQPAEPADPSRETNATPDGPVERGPNDALILQ